jgi:hypothetical protein
MHGENGPLSSAHWYVRLEPLAVNSKVAFRRSSLSHGSEVMRTGGASPPTIHPYSAGNSLRLPAASTARTANSWSPKSRLVYVFGDVHGVKISSSTISSIAHSNVMSGVWMSETNSKVAVVEVLSSSGAFVMAAFGRAPIVHR